MYLLLSDFIGPGIVYLNSRATRCACAAAMDDGRLVAQVAPRSALDHEGIVILCASSRFFAFLVVITFSVRDAMLNNIVHMFFCIEYSWCFPSCYFSDGCLSSLPFADYRIRPTRAPTCGLGILGNLPLQVPLLTITRHKWQKRRVMELYPTRGRNSYPSAYGLRLRELACRRFRQAQVPARAMHAPGCAPAALGRPRGAGSSVRKQPDGPACFRPKRHV